MIWPYTFGAKPERAPARLDNWLPRKAYLLEHHAIDLAVTEAAALTALTEMPMASLPLVRALFTLRGISYRSEMMQMQFFSTPPFLILEKTDQEIVFGVINRPSRQDRGRMLPTTLPISPEEFRAALEKDRMAAFGNFRVDPLPDGVQLWTETWVFTPKFKQQAAFTAYWLVIGPFSAWIRRMFLAKAKQRAG